MSPVTEGSVMDFRNPCSLVPVGRGTLERGNRRPGGRTPRPSQHTDAETAASETNDPDGTDGRFTAPEDPVNR